jgi:hypothetical protein
VLAFSIVSTIAPIESQIAYAEKGGKKSTEKGEKSKDQRNNQTSSTHEQKEGKKIKGNEKIKERANKPAWERQLNQTADEIHEKHLKLRAGFSGGYTPGLTYSLSANGTADAIGNSTDVGDAKLSVEMSVWKSTRGQVKMDITGGSLTVDEKSMQVHSGHAHYWVKNNRMLVIAFVIEGTVTSNNDETTANNQTSTTNQTSSSNQTSTAIEEPEEDGSDTKFRVMKLWLKVDEDSGQLPTVDSSEPIKVEVMSRQSKLASMWFLEMSGEVALST